MYEVKLFETKISGMVIKITVLFFRDIRARFIYRISNSIVPRILRYLPVNIDHGVCIIN